MEQKQKKAFRELGFNKQIDAIEADECPFCRRKIDLKDFRNKISKERYETSGVCQSCQDEMEEKYK